MIKCVFLMSVVFIFRAVTMWWTIRIFCILNTLDTCWRCGIHTKVIELHQCNWNSHRCLAVICFFHLHFVVSFLLCRCEAKPRIQFVSLWCCNLDCRCVTGGWCSAGWLTVTLSGLSRDAWIGWASIKLLVTPVPPTEFVLNKDW